MDAAKLNSTQPSEVTALVDALKQALSTNDLATPLKRQHLKETAGKLSIALETPGETVQRIAYYVSSHSEPPSLKLISQDLQCR